VGPDEDSTRPAADQEHGRRKRPTRRPRTRGCLLKGCNQRFHPREARERYCSQQCRQAARQWSRWKAQRSYRATAAGKAKRNGQSRRYRERVRKRQQQAAPEAARVITKDFFSTTVATGPAAMRDSRSGGDHPCGASVPARAGAPWNAFGNGSGAGAGCVPAAEVRAGPGASDNPDILIP
jgi:hypothetical protein